MRAGMTPESDSLSLKRRTVTAARGVRRLKGRLVRGAA